MNELNIYTKKKKNWKTKTSDVIPCYERHEHAALTFLSFHITLIAYGLVWFNFCDGWDHVWNEIHANTCFFFFFCYCPFHSLRTSALIYLGYAHHTKWILATVQLRIFKYLLVSDTSHQPISRESTSRHSSSSAPWHIISLASFRSIITSCPTSSDLLFFFLL